jgi:hypothetical protein
LNAPGSVMSAIYMIIAFLVVLAGLNFAEHGRFD